MPPWHAVGSDEDRALLLRRLQSADGRMRRALTFTLHLCLLATSLAVPIATSQTTLNPNPLLAPTPQNHSNWCDSFELADGSADSLQAFRPANASEGYADSEAFEVTHQFYANEEQWDARWLYHTPGSGLWYDPGKTLVVQTHAELNDLWDLPCLWCTTNCTMKRACPVSIQRPLGDALPRLLPSALPNPQSLVDRDWPPQATSARATSAHLSSRKPSAALVRRGTRPSRSFDIGWTSKRAMGCPSMRYWI